MENQVTQLKLNVTNIKSSLLSSNKQLKKLKTDKKNLFFKLEKKQELRAEETRLETSKLGIGSGFSKIMSAVTSPVRSIFDRILDFIGLIAAGILINNLPIIIEKIQEFFNSDFIKGVGNVLGIIGNAILGLAKFVGIFPKSEQDQVEKNIKETDKRFDENIKDADAAEKDIVNLEKFLGQTDSGIDEEPIEPIDSDSSIPQSILETPISSSPSNTESNTKEITASKPAQSFNSGGTVRSEGPSQTPSLAQKQTYTPQKSGVSKKVQRDANDGFTNFPIAVDNIHKSTKEQEKNIIAFSKMLKDSRGLGTTSSSSGSPGGPNGPGGPSGNGGGLVNIPGGGKISGNASVTQRNDPDAEQTGIDISLRDSDGNFANGALIQNPFQSLTITSTGSQINPNGSGYGNYVTGETLINGKRYELLIGHLGKISVSKGQILNSGHILGTQGMTGSSTGPHVTTHINALDGGNPQTILNAVEDSWINGTVVKTDEKKSNKGPTLTPSQQNKYRNNKGGGLRLNRSMNNQSVFIYAIQPQETFVPFPYPMPIETPAPSSSSTPQLSAIWRT
tara:strand:+ start:170 stop:1858 length:1689 start_codon:yes stop_codon:yes gene_type:complete